MLAVASLRLIFRVIHRRIFKGVNITATYISLVQFTEKGMQAARETTQRVTEWAAKVKPMGVNIKDMYWTLGQYDQVCVFEAPNDETAASVLLGSGMLGNIRTHTLRAFIAAEMKSILEKADYPREMPAGAK